MPGAARVGKPGVAQVLGDGAVVERLDRVALAVVEAAGLQAWAFLERRLPAPGGGVEAAGLRAGAFLERRLPALGVVVAAGAQQVRGAEATLVQADRATKACEHA